MLPDSAILFNQGLSDKWVQKGEFMRDHADVRADFSRSTGRGS
jgi:hypothetical protein